MSSSLSIIARVRRRIPRRAVLLAALRPPQPYPPSHEVIDAHVHLNSAFAGRWRGRPLGDVLAALDRAGVRGLVNLDGGDSEALDGEIARLQVPAPDRIAVFTGLDTARFAREARFGEVAARLLRDAVGHGARGLKVWKTLGLVARDPAGRLIQIDDPRLSPLWEAAAELRIPVLIHVADPAAFFRPLDEHNERAAELRLYPEWHRWPVRATRDGPGFPSHGELIDQFEALLSAQPATTFIGAHLASCGEDLDRLSTMLTEHPNLNVDIAARINELGRHPEDARRLMTRFSDRILFGTDSGPDPRWYAVYFRFLESSARGMNYSVFDPPLQGDWRVDGLALPDEVLRQVYSGNARRLIRFDA